MTTGADIQAEDSDLRGEVVSRPAVSSPATPVPSGRREKILLWNSPQAVLLSGMAGAISIAIALAQMSLRHGFLDPDRTPIFLRLFLFQDYPGSLLVLLCLLVALVPAVQRAGERLVASFAGAPLRVALLAFVVFAAGAWFVYLRHPLAMDEYVPYLQSQIFAAGHLVGRYPVPLLDWLIFPQFQDFFIHVSNRTGELASAYWPGFALLLTPFTAIGLPWLCNPAISALSLVALYVCANRLTGSRQAGGICILFALASPTFTINAFSFYSMPAHLLLNAVFACLLLEPSPRRAFAAGLVGGLALTLHNPVPHALFAVPWLIWLLLRQDRLRTITAIAAGYMPWIVLVGFGWQYVLILVRDVEPAAPVTSGVFDFGRVIALLGRVLSLPSVGIVEARLIGLAKLWVWSSPALILVAAIGFWRWRHDVRVRLLLLSAATTFAGYLFVPMDQGHGWGFRYLHSAWFVLPVLAAAAFVARPDRNGARISRHAQPVAMYALGAALAGMVVMQPYYSWEVRGFIRQHLAQMPILEHGSPRVVILNPGAGYYAQDLVQNDPFLRNETIIMATRGRAADAEMMQKNFPELVLLQKSYRGTVWGPPE